MLGAILMTAALLAACIGLDFPARAQDSLGKQEERYQSEKDPVRKAKELAKLGLMEMDAARADLKNGKEPMALAAAQRYRDQVRETLAMLQQSGIDAERHPAGFKELQISVRECMRKIDDFTVSVPYERQDGFRQVHSDLVDLQSALMNALFPEGNTRGKRTK